MTFVNKWITGLIALVSVAAFGAPETWKIDDAHSVAQFTIKHMMVTNVSGQISGIKGAFVIDSADPTSLVIDANLDPKTINTNNAKRDAHLKDPDFFDVKKNPTMTFKSKLVKKTDTGFDITGDLTMHGTKKEVTLKAEPITQPVKDAWGGVRRGFSATTQINRKDFGLTWNKNLDAGGLALGDDVKVNIEISLVPDKPTKTGSKS